LNRRQRRKQRGQVLSFVTFVAFCSLILRFGAGGGDETSEERMGVVGLALEFRVELAGEKERMGRQLDQLHQFVVRGKAAEDKARFFKGGAIGVVEFVTVAVALVGHESAVEASGLRTDGQLAGLEAQPHGAAFAVMFFWSSSRAMTG